MHAQYYVGKAQGFYEKEGIDLEIRPPAAGQQNEVLIGTGKEQFGVGNIDSFVKAKSSGLPIVSVMMDQPDNPFAVVTLVKNGIDSPAKMKGMKLAWFQTNVPAMIDPMLKSGNLSRKDIEFVSVARGSEVQMLAAGQVDALFGFSYGQALTLESKGFPVRVFPIRDFGVRLYGTHIYTHEDLIKKNPDLVKRFVRATLKSLIWTHDNVEEAMKEVVKVSPDRDHKLESRKLRMIYDMYNNGDYAARFGQMTNDKWASTIEIMATAGDLIKKPAPSAMYTNQFVDALDEAKTLATLIKQPAK
jgi:NitT/TauT family transport system substrate-binding protein